MDASQSINRYTERRLRAKTLRLSSIEGCIATVMGGLVMVFYVPYLNEMGATTLQIGLGVSLPSLLGGFVQLYTPRALQTFGSRKKLIMFGCFAQAVCFIPFGLMCYLNRNWAVWPTIAAFLVSAAFGNLGLSAWFDWLASIVPARRKGKYFAMRNTIFNIVLLLTAAIAGRFLDYAATIAKTLLMFTLIWMVCFVIRMVSGALFHYHYDPPAAANGRKTNGDFWKFIAELHSMQFGKFTLATSLLNFGVNFAAPFFAVYMLNNLRYNYMNYTIMTIAPTVAVIVTSGLWGSICDRIGTVLPMRLCALTITFLPLCWVLTENYVLLLATQLLAGFVWNGFALSTWNFAIASLEPDRRVSSFAYFNFINFIFVFLGGTLGGWVAPHMPVLAHYKLQTVFAVSALMRIAPALIFQFIQEEKHYAKLNPLERFFFDSTISLSAGVSRIMPRRKKLQGELDS